MDKRKNTRSNLMKLLFAIPAGSLLGKYMLDFHDPLRLLLFILLCSLMGKWLAEVEV